MSDQLGKYLPCENPFTIFKQTLNHATGEISHEQFDKRCGSRRKDLCEPCSIVWKDDAYFALMKGARGKSGELTFITLTAPGSKTFGKCHTAQHHGKASERCVCRKYHTPEDPLVGVPLDKRDFQHQKVVEFNNYAPRLLSVTVQKIFRLLATSQGVTAKEARLPMARVFEWQERNLLHCHIIVLGSIPKDIVDAAVNGRAKSYKGRRVVPAEHKGHRWGTQVDVKHINSGQEAELKKLSTYVTKVVGYALKDVTGAGKEKDLEKAAFRSELRKHTNSVIKCDKSWAKCSAAHNGNPTLIVRNGELPTRHFCSKHRRGHHQLGFTGNVLSLNRSWGSSLKEARERRRAFAQKRAKPALAAVKAASLEPEKNSVTYVVVRKHVQEQNDLLASMRRAWTVSFGRNYPPQIPKKEEKRCAYQLTLIS